MTIHPEHSNNPAQDENLIDELEEALKTTFSEYITVKDHKININELRSQYQRELQERCDALEKKFQERYDALEKKFQGQYQQLQQQLTEHTHPNSSNENGAHPHQPSDPVLNGENGADNAAADCSSNTPAHDDNTNPYQSAGLVPSGENVSANRDTTLTGNTTGPTTYKHPLITQLHTTYRNNIVNNKVDNLLQKADDLCEKYKDECTGILYLTEMCCVILKEQQSNEILKVRDLIITNFKPEKIDSHHKEQARTILDAYQKAKNSSSTLFHFLLATLTIQNNIGKMHTKISKHFNEQKRSSSGTNPSKTN